MWQKYSKTCEKAEFFAPLLLNKFINKGGRPLFILYHKGGEKMEEVRKLLIDMDFVNRFGLFQTILLAFMLEKEEKGVDEDGWFCLTNEEVKNQLGLSTRIQVSIIKEFEDLGLLERKVKGLPAKRHIRLNHSKLEEISKKGGK